MKMSFCDILVIELLINKSFSIYSSSGHERLTFSNIFYEIFYSWKTGKVKTY